MARRYTQPMPAPPPAEPHLPANLTTWANGSMPEDGDELVAVEVRHAQWPGLAVRDLRLEEAVFDAGDLSGATLTDVTMRDLVFRDPNLANAVIRGGSLSRVEIAGGRLTGLRLPESELRDVVWRNSAADMAAFRHARLHRVMFDGCNLRQADFMGARFEQARFQDCDLAGAAFAHARFVDSELRRCRMSGIEGIDGLRGAAIDLEQVLDLAPALAAALGIAVLPD